MAMKSTIVALFLASLQLSCNAQDDQVASSLRKRQLQTTTSAAPSASPSASPTVTPASFTLDVCQSADLEEVLLREQFESDSTRGWTNGVLSGGGTFAPFSQFLGPFTRDSSFPTRTYQFPDKEISTLQYAFQFIEGDSWDQTGRHGPDTFSVVVSGDTGTSETIAFGAFNGQTSDGTLPTSGISTPNGLISWTRSGATPASIGGSPSFQDQIHTINLSIPFAFITDYDLTVTFQWSLQGNDDEFVGIDNIQIVRCIDTVPSASPTAPTFSPVPSLSPSFSGSPTSSPSFSLMPSTSSSPSATPSTSNAPTS